MSKKEKIIRILKENVFELSDVDINDDLKLISSGLLESFDVINLLDIFESTFNIKISLEDVELESFNTVNKMESLINKYE